MGLLHNGKEKVKSYKKNQDEKERTEKETPKKGREK